jgi:hypothetical protein
MRAVFSLHRHPADHEIDCSFAGVSRRTHHDQPGKTQRAATPVGAGRPPQEELKIT